MYILNKNGDRLIKTEDIVDFRVEDETKEYRAEHPAAKRQEYHVIRAYFELNNKGKSVVLAAYDDEDIAINVFSQCVTAIGSGATVFKFCPDDENNGKNEMEETIEMEP